MFTAPIWCCKHKPKLEGKALQEEKRRHPRELAPRAGMSLLWGKRDPESGSPIPLAVALREGNPWLCLGSPSAPSTGPVPLLRVQSWVGGTPLVPLPAVSPPQAAPSPICLQRGLRFEFCLHLILVCISCCHLPGPRAAASQPRIA